MLNSAQLGLAGAQAELGKILNLESLVVKGKHWLAWASLRSQEINFPRWVAGWVGGRLEKVKIKPSQPSWSWGCG